MEQGKTRECPACALEGPAGTDTCPYCGYEFPDRMPRSTVWVAILMAALLAWPVFRLVRSLF